MKSPIEKALEKVGKINVVEMEEEKPQKSKKGEIPVPYRSVPRLYLTDKDLPDIYKYKAGDKLILVMECCVEGVSSYERSEGKEVKKQCSCDLCIEAIADITKG